jgi:hypothetical protein
MNTDNEPDLFTALEAKQAAFDHMETTERPWFDHAIEAVAKLPFGWEGTGEDVRLFLYELGVALPLKQQAWGALMHHAAKRNLVHETGEWRPMRLKESHARRTPVYRRG